MSYELNKRRTRINPEVYEQSVHRAIGQRLNTSLGQYLADKQYIPGTGVDVVPGEADEVGIRATEFSVGSGRTTEMSKQKATSYGRKMGKMMSEDPMVKELVGSGFFQDFARGFMMPFKAISSIAKPVLGLIPHPAAQVAKVGLDLAGLGKASEEAKEVEERMEDEEEVADTGAVDENVGGMKAKPKKKRTISDKMRKRAMLVKKLMKDEKMSLAQASKAIKDRQLM
jgi:hypothetical protein